MLDKEKRVSTELPLPFELLLLILKELDIKDATSLSITTYLFYHNIVKFKLNKYIELIPDAKINNPIEKSEEYRMFSNNIPIISAASIGSVECIIAAIKKGANINSIKTKKKFSGSGGETALIEAVKQDHENIVNYLIENGADIFLTDSNGETVLHIAAINNSIKSLKILCEYEKKLSFEKTNNCYNNHNLLPIMIASELGNETCVSVLSNFAKEMKNKENYNNLHEIFLNDTIKRITSTFEKGHVGFQSNFHTWMNILYKGDLKVLESYLNSSTMIMGFTDIHYEKKQNLIHVVIKMGNKKALNLFVDFIINVDNIILDVAIGNGTISKNLKKRIKLLINEPDHQGNTPLHLAAERGDLELIKILFSNNLAIESLHKNNSKGKMPKDLTNSRHVLNYLSKDNWPLYDLQKDFDDVPFKWQHHIDFSGCPSGTVIPLMKQYQKIFEVNDNKEKQEYAGRNNFMDRKNKPLTPEEIWAYHWYNNDEINQLLKYYLGRNSEVDILIGMSLSQRSGETFFRNLQDTLQNDAEKLSRREQLSKFIVIPVNLGPFDINDEESGTHWASLVLYFPALKNRLTPLVFYCDPYGNSIPPELKNILLKIYSELQGDNIKISDQNLQDDGHSCGAWMIEIARHIILHQNLPKFGDINIEQAKKEHFQIISGKNESNYFSKETSNMFVGIFFNKTDYLNVIKNIFPDENWRITEKNTINTIWLKINDEELAKKIVKHFKNNGYEGILLDYQKENHIPVLVLKNVNYNYRKLKMIPPFITLKHSEECNSKPCFDG